MVVLGIVVREEGVIIGVVGAVVDAGDAVADARGISVKTFAVVDSEQGTSGGFRDGPFPWRDKVLEGRMYTSPPIVRAPSSFLLFLWCPVTTFEGVPDFVREQIPFLVFLWCCLFVEGGHFDGDFDLVSTGGISCKHKVVEVSATVGLNMGLCVH